MNPLTFSFPMTNEGIKEGAGKLTEVLKQNTSKCVITLIFKPEQNTAHEYSAVFKQKKHINKLQFNGLNGEQKKIIFDALKISNVLVHETDDNAPILRAPKGGGAIVDGDAYAFRGINGLDEASMKILGLDEATMKKIFGGK